MGDVARHTRRLEATREIFVPVVGDVQYDQGLGAFFGILINADGEYAYITVYVPWDFLSLHECKVVHIPRATFAAGAPMSLRVVTGSPQIGQPYFEQNTNVDYVTAATINMLAELEITGQVDRGILQAKDYLAIQVSRQQGQNTDTIILGVRFKYQINPGRIL